METLVKPETTVKLCENPKCNQPLRVKAGESPAQFRKRRFCDRRCQNEWRSTRPVTRKVMPSIKLNRQLRAGPKRHKGGVLVQPDGHVHVWVMETGHSTRGPHDPTLGWRGHCTLCDATRFDVDPDLYRGG